MSVRTARFSIERPTMIRCLFCEKPGNLVIDPDEDAYHAIKNVADERQDATRDKFYFLYNDSLSRQCFSWHVKCATSYICFDDHKCQKRPQVVPKQEVKQECKHEIKKEIKTEEADEEVRVKIEGVSDTQEVQYSVRRGISPEEITRCLICNKQLNVVLSQAPSRKSRLSAAKLIYDTAHRKHDGVFIKIRRYHSPKDMIDKGMHYHKACYVSYVYPPPKCSEQQRPGKISRKEMFNGMKKLLDEIDDKLSTGCLELAYLAQRLATLTEVEDAIIEPETVKSLLVANYGERLLFSYPAGVESCVVFLSRVPLSEVMKRLR